MIKQMKTIFEIFQQKFLQAFTHSFLHFLHYLFIIANIGKMMQNPKRRMMQIQNFVQNSEFIITLKDHNNIICYLCLNLKFTYNLIMVSINEL